jgi:hypothetical protein
VIVGLFSGKQNRKGLYIQFPDGSEVSNQADIDRLFAHYSFTPSSISNWRLERPDIEACASASAKLFSIGLNDETMIAFGPVQLGGFPKVHNDYIADAILTPNLLVIYFQKNLLVPDYLILHLKNLSGLTSIGPWSAQFNFQNGIHRDKNGVFEMAETYFVLSERLGKDGHANRRSVTFMRSLANTLNEIHMA